MTKDNKKHHSSGHHSSDKLPRTDHEHHQVNDKHRHSAGSISFFNEVNITNPINQNVAVKAKDESKEDGISGCFKAMFGCAKKSSP
jgi:hypothetical protein